MKKSSITILLILGVFIIGCKPSKNETLNHIKLCLEIQHETSVLFNERNLYLQKIVVAKNNNNQSLDKSNLDKIDSLNIEISQSVKEYLDILKKEKKIFPDKTLVNGLIEYLESIENFEKEFEVYLALIRNTIQNNEEQQSVTIRELALGLQSETKKLNNLKEVFYKKNNISNREIDSLVNLVRK